MKLFKQVWNYIRNLAFVFGVVAVMVLAVVGATKVPGEPVLQNLRARRRDVEWEWNKQRTELRFLQGLKASEWIAREKHLRAVQLVRLGRNVGKVETRIGILSEYLGGLRRNLVLTRRAIKQRELTGKDVSSLKEEVASLKPQALEKEILLAAERKILFDMHEQIKSLSTKIEPNEGDFHGLLSEKQSHVDDLAQDLVSLEDQIEDHKAELSHVGTVKRFAKRVAKGAKEVKERIANIPLWRKRPRVGEEVAKSA